MRTKSFLTLFIYCLISSITSFAQTTIGSNNAPPNGAILQLKQDESLTNNSTKGLVLPRVALTDKNNLYPMFAGDTDYENNKANKKTDEDLVHQGLIVYNMTTNACENLYVGVQVWSGKEWLPLVKDNRLNETDILVDNRDPAKPAEYAIGRFVDKDGGDAGWWMLENLRAEIWPDGNTTDLGLSMIEPPLQLDPSNAPNPIYADAHFYYPSLDGTTLSKSSAQGYMYNFHAAARTAKNYVDASEATRGQGMCPNGWHLPTSQDWKDLFIAVAGNPCPYSYAKEPVANSGASGYMFLSQTEPGGLSRPTEDGGFNAKALGIIGRDQTTGKIVINEFGNYAAHWISNGNEPTGTRRAAYAVFAGQGAGYFSSGYGWVPIRCKKD